MERERRAAPTGAATDPAAGGDLPIPPPAPPPEARERPALPGIADAADALVAASASFTEDCCGLEAVGQGHAVGVDRAAPRLHVAGGHFGTVFRLGWGWCVA